jgi:6-phosphogluconate dehydrogenase (decarboxylating)
MGFNMVRRLLRDRHRLLWIITASLFSRFRSRAENPFADRLLAALRHEFGGHAVKKA